MQAEGHEPVNAEENVEQLRQWLESFSREFNVASSRKQRLEDVMSRKGAKRWSHLKSSKMVRRLVTATKIVESSSDALDRIAHRLSQNGVEIEIEHYKTWSQQPTSN